jgi:hypothetical protein
MGSKTPELTEAGGASLRLRPRHRPDFISPLEAAFAKLDNNCLRKSRTHASHIGIAQDRGSDALVFLRLLFRRIYRMTVVQ